MELTKTKLSNWKWINFTRHQDRSAISLAPQIRLYSIAWRKTPIWRETRRSSSRGTFRTQPPFTSNKPTNFSIQKKLLKNWLQTNSARYSQKLTRGRQIIRPQKDRVQPWTPTQVILKRITPIFMGQTNTRSKAKVSREVSPHFSPILKPSWFVVF